MIVQYTCHTVGNFCEVHNFVFLCSLLFSSIEFEKLKQMLISAPLMKNLDFNRMFILQTNASSVGIGAVLSQSEEEDQPIAYFS